MLAVSVTAAVLFTLMVVVRLNVAGLRPVTFADPVSVPNTVGVAVTEACPLMPVKAEPPPENDNPAPLKVT